MGNWVLSKAFGRERPGKGILKSHGWEAVLGEGTRSLKEAGALGSRAESASRRRGARLRSRPLLAVLSLSLLALGVTAAPASAASTTKPVVSKISYTSAHVTGEVLAEGFTQYEFQYSTDDTNWTTFAADLRFGAEFEPIEANLTGLEPGTKYYVRLAAGPFVPEVFSPEPNPFFSTFPTSFVVPQPTVVIDPVTIKPDMTAKFSGTVNANAPAGPLTPLEEEAFESEWKFVCSPECPGLTGGVVKAGEGAKAVSVEAEKLEPNTTYEITLEATNIGGTGSDKKNGSVTVPPVVKAAPGASDGKGGYVLEGVVNSRNNVLTSCEFKYGPIVPYAFAIPCSPTPGKVNKNVTVEAHVTGLTPDATYHAQLVVTSSSGGANGGDQLFIPTLDPAENCPNERARIENSSLALPECRSYEMVSAPNKVGNPATFSGLAYPWLSPGFSEDGESFAYLSLGASNINNSGQGSLVNFYVANRTSAGWETRRNLNGEHGSLYAPPYNLYERGPIPVGYSANVQTSLWAVEPGGESFADSNLYLRNPDGSFTKIGNGNSGPGAYGPAGGGAYISIESVLATSDDLSHVLMKSEGFFGSLYGPGLWEFIGTNNTQPHRVDVDNTGAGFPYCGDHSSRGYTMSNDGRVIVFEPCDGSIWARVGDSFSVDASASHCTRTAGDVGGLCNAPSPPTFEGVSDDGSRIFFTTKQQLVNGDTDSTTDLYVCDVPSGNPAPVGTANPCSSLTEVSGAAPGANVETPIIAINRDGSTAYFIGQGAVLADNDGVQEEEPAKPGDRNLYVWHSDAANPSGETTFITKLEIDDVSGVGQPNRFTPNLFDRSRVTPDGRFLVFSTANQIGLTDSDNVRDIYRYDRDTGQAARITTNIYGLGGNTENAALLRPDAVADDGAVVFTTAEPLSPIDGNEDYDVYLYNHGRVRMITTGSVGAGEYYDAVAIDASGRDIFFQTKQPLVPSDGDNVTDVYDARIEGGFPLPPDTSCSGEACQPAPSAPPVTPSSPVNRSGGEGNFKPKRCGKNKVLRKTHCVKKATKKKAKKSKGKRTARADRGGAR